MRQDVRPGKKAWDKARYGIGQCIGQGKAWDKAIHFLFAEGLGVGVELGKGVGIAVYRNVGDVIH
jgi:hypothetical protein